MAEIRDEIWQLLRELDGRQTERIADDQPLELDSLIVVQLHDRLEQTFDLRIRAKELTPANFGTLGGLTKLVSRLLDER